MKKQILPAILAAMLLALSGCGAETEPAEPATIEGEVASAAEVSDHPYFSPFETIDIYGEAISSDILTGHKLTMVNVWATFCGPCVGEMPELQKLAEKYADRGFQVIGIVTDCCDMYGKPVQSQLDKAKSIAESCGTNYTHVFPTVSMYSEHLNNMMYVPTTVFLNERGEQIGEEIVGARESDLWELTILGMFHEVE